MMRPYCNLLLIALSLLLAACGASVNPVFPTPVPTETALVETRLPATAAVAASTRTPVPTSSRLPPTGGPSPTSILGVTRTPDPVGESATPLPNPNAPRIEFFTADLAYVLPGDAVTLFWSVRGADRAAIYQLDALGQRSQLWNVEPSGSQVIETNRNDRGEVDFLLTIERDNFYVEQLLTIPLLCAYAWFFEPAPVACADSAAINSPHIEQVFEGGRMIYVGEQNLVYVLFADGRDPGWTSFSNRYVEGVSLDQDPNFVPPPERYQPVHILGTIWRASDPVRNRLRLGLAPETAYEGAIQADGEFESTIYIRSSDGSILQLDPDGVSWGILAVP